MITIRTDRKSFCRLSGHARYSAYGYDIVCAGISTLFNTLAMSIDNAEIEQYNGEYSLKSAPTPKNIVRFEMFSKGCEAISEKYPNNVKFKAV